MIDMGSDIALLEDEMQEFNFEKSVKNNLKTQEELDKLTVDESLNEFDRALFIISSGQEVQYISVLKSLPHLLRHWQSECLRRLIPKIRDNLQLSSNDIQLAAAEVFVVIIKEELVPIAQYTQHFLRTIITNVDNRDTLVSKAWLDSLLSVIQYLPRDVVKREVLGLAIAKGQLSQPTASRISCCSILGAIATKFDSNILKKDVVHSVKQLCQDVDFEVRACMCNYLYKISKGLGPEETKKYILDEILELANDEEISVREAALEAILSMTNLLDKPTLVENIIPLMCKYCEQAFENEDATLLSVVKNFGKICHLLSDNFNSDQRAWYLSCYQYLCRIGSTTIDSISRRNSGNVQGHPDLLRFSHSQEASMLFSDNANINLHRTPSNLQQITPAKQELYVECRRACAYNLPAMVLFAGNNAFKSDLMDSMTLLCQDPDVIARKHTSAGLHEIAEVLGDQSFLVHSHLILMLKEKQSVVVLNTLLHHLTQTIHAIVNRGGYGLTEYNPNAISELIAAILVAMSRLEQQWPSAWRAMESLVIHMQHLPDILTSDQIYYKFVPHYLPVKEAAVCTACIFIRHNRRQEQRKEMCNRLVKDLCYGTKYKNRILFFTACQKMMSLFSRSFVKEHLFEHVIGLFHDPVPNVRLCLCKILPSLKSLLKLPRDRSLHQQLESSVRRMLSSEKDRDVSNAIRFAILELDRTEVAMESLTQHMFLEEDLQDHKKEEEERLLIEREERSKSEDNRSLKSHSNSNSSVGKSGTSRLEKSHKSKKSSKTSGTSLSSGTSHKTSRKDKDRNKIHHVTSTQQTPTMYSHQKDVLNNNSKDFHFSSSLPGSTFSDHQISDNHNNDINNYTNTKEHAVASKTYSASDALMHPLKSSLNKPHRSIGNILSNQNKLERKISSPLSSNSNSPSLNRHSNSPSDSSKSRRSSLGNSSINTSSAKTSSKNINQVSSNKSTIRRKNSQTLGKKTDRNGHVR